MDEYLDNFIDNGYDDLETVKLIKREDVEAIGVIEQQQDYILEAVQVLRERGGTWVYLLGCDDVDDSESDDDDHDYYSSDKFAQDGSSGIESHKSSLYQPSDETFSDGSFAEVNRLSGYIPELHFQGKTKNVFST